MGRMDAMSTMFISHEPNVELEHLVTMALYETLRNEHDIFIDRSKLEKKERMDPEEN